MGSSRPSQRAERLAQRAQAQAAQGQAAQGQAAGGVAPAAAPIQPQFQARPTGT
jgi:hypothetical protein